MTSTGGFLPEPLPSAARERVVERLTHLYATDELSETVFEAHLQRVYAATSSQELDAIVASLPAPPPAQDTLAIGALFSGQERKVVTVVPRELSLRARLGYVELDLTEATFEPGVTTIDARAFLGYVQIRFPAGVRVENAGRTLFGLFALKGAAPASAGDAPAASVVRVTGRAVLGFAEAIVVE